MEHIVNKVKSHFNLEKDAALIDVEIFLNKQKPKKIWWETKFIYLT